MLDARPNLPYTLLDPGTAPFTLMQPQPGKRRLCGMRNHFYTVRKILAVVTGLLLALVLYSAWDIYNYGNNRATLQTDAAIVLGAAAWGERPSPVFRERINHAIALYQRGDVRAIIFTGGQGDLDEPPEAIVAKRYAIERGVPEAAILTETQSRTTQQNLYYAGQVAAEHHLTQLLIVSDPLHMKRAIAMAKDLGMEAYPSPTPTTRYQSAGSQIEFLARETYFYLTYLAGRPFDPLLQTGNADA